MSSQKAKLFAALVAIFAIVLTVVVPTSYAQTGSGEPPSAFVCQLAIVFGRYTTMAECYTALTVPSTPAVEPAARPSAPAMAPAASSGGISVTTGVTPTLTALDDLFGTDEYRCFPDRQDAVKVLSWPRNTVVSGWLAIVDQPYKTYTSGQPDVGVSATAYFAVGLADADYANCPKMPTATGTNLSITLDQVRTSLKGVGFQCFADRLDAIYVPAWPGGILNPPFTNADAARGTVIRGSEIVTGTSATLWLEGKFAQSEWSVCQKRGLGRADVSSTASRLDALFGTAGWMCFSDRLDAAYVTAWPNNLQVTYPVTVVNGPAGDYETGDSVPQGISATVWLDVPLRTAECRSYEPVGG